MLFCCVIFVVVFVNFGLSTYSVNESSEIIELDLQFSNPSSTDISVQVTNHDITANSIGMYVYSINMYRVYLNTFM